MNAERKQKEFEQHYLKCHRCYITIENQIPNETINPDKLCRKGRRLYEHIPGNPVKQTLTTNEDIINRHERRSPDYRRKYGV